MDVLSSKKGAIGSDILMFVLLAFLMVMVAGIVYWTYTIIKPGIVDAVTTQDGKDIINESYAGFPSIFDYGILFILLGAWAAIIIGSFLIDTHPIFLIIGVVVLAMSFMVAIYLANIYSDITEDDTDMEFMRTDFPISYWIMSHLLELCIVVGSSTALALYGKWKFA